MGSSSVRCDRGGITYYSVTVAAILYMAILLRCDRGGFTYYSYTFYGYLAYIYTILATVPYMISVQPLIYIGGTVVATGASGLTLVSVSTWMVKGGGIGGFGGSSLEPPRRWLGAQWLGLTLGVPSCAEPPGAR